jgi:hypothetical protein
MFRSATIIMETSLCRARLVPLCATQNTHAILGHAASPQHNKLRRNLTECFDINISLAGLNYKLPDDGRRPKHVAAI